LSAELESVSASLAELEEEEGGEEGVFAEFEKVNKPAVTARVKEARAIYTPIVTASDSEAVSTDKGIASGKVQERPRNDSDELGVLEEWLELTNREAELKKELKDAEAELDAKAYAHYPKLSEAEVNALVVEDKWLAALEAATSGEMDRVSQSLTQRVKELSERYETPMPQLTARVDELETKVNQHLEKMGFSWK
ncbi:MAG: type I restriction endonuclease subunit M, partial [Anaerolineales bacterium]|nr:type I restriction endonuclease subunit M [Anaerolineales bacterium]